MSEPIRDLESPFPSSQRGRYELVIHLILPLDDIAPMLMELTMNYREGQRAPAATA